MNKSSSHIVFIIGLIGACIFVLTSMIWIYWIAVIIGVPSAILAYIQWVKLRNLLDRKHTVVAILLIVGFVLFFGSLLYYFIKY